MFAQAEDSKQDCVKKIHFSTFNTFPEISCQRASRSGWFIVFNDSASPKIVMKTYFNFVRLSLKPYPDGKGVA